ncbi:hypothetical protein DRN98_07825, partial [Methanosarcinales archaeon]
GTPDLWERIKEHRLRSRESEHRKRLKRRQARKEAIEIILQKLRDFIQEKTNEGAFIERVIEEVVMRRKTPLRASEEIWQKLAHSGRIFEDAIVKHKSGKI